MTGVPQFIPCSRNTWRAPWAGARLQASVALVGLVLAIGSCGGDDAQPVGLSSTTTQAVDVTSSSTTTTTVPAYDAVIKAVTN